MGLLIFVGGYLAVLVVTARIWEARPALRCLPIVYGIFTGVILQHSEDGLMWKILNGTAFGISSGLLGMLITWIANREWRK